MKTKKCSNPGCLDPIKPISEFHRDKSKPDGHRPDCKICNTKRIKKYNDNHKIEKSNYDKERRNKIPSKLAEQKHIYYLKNKKNIQKKEKERHEKFPWKRVFYGIKDRCENINDEAYHRYGGRGIECLITEKQIEYLWNRDKAYNMVKPTIDRKNNNLNYTIGNCEFIEHVINTGKDRRKPVLQFDLNGKFIKGFNSVKEASKKTKIEYKVISAIASGINNSKYIWRYK